MFINWDDLRESLPPVQPLTESQQRQIQTLRQSITQKLQDLESSLNLLQRSALALPKTQWRQFLALDEYHQWLLIDNIMKAAMTFWHGTDHDPERCEECQWHGVPTEH